MSGIVNKESLPSKFATFLNLGLRARIRGFKMQSLPLRGAHAGGGAHVCVWQRYSDGGPCDVL